mmetsp:Transcript_37683/g.88140  ORF Transcript_37683/g.88140 Transcript_37683/m.88140 type:complete len:88 (-) Transcript_37683:279-542(-)
MPEFDGADEACRTRACPKKACEQRRCIEPEPLATHMYMLNMGTTKAEAPKEAPAACAMLPPARGALVGCKLAHRSTALLLPLPVHCC